MKVRTAFALVMLLVASGGFADRSPLGAQSARPMTSLDKLLAPIALYPDQLLAQILMSASDPPKVQELDKFLKANQSLKGTQLQDAALKAGFEPSFVALALFPQVVAQMTADINSTTLLGQAFIADRSAVFKSIQGLRHQAQQVGTLKSTSQQEVSHQTTSSGDDVIVIEPTNPQVVYVPQYNSQVVYTQAPTTTTTVVVQDSSADAAVAAGLIGFTAGIAIGAAIDNNYYYGPYGWHGGGYMYNDAWDDYYDHREDAREDWMDHREDIMEERGDRAENRQEQRGDRQGTTQQRTERQQNRTENRASGEQATGQRASGTSATTQSVQRQSTSRTGSAEARGYGEGSGSRQSASARAGGADAFSGYSSGKSTRSSSARGQRSRSSSRSGGRRR